MNWYIFKKIMTWIKQKRQTNEWDPGFLFILLFFVCFKFERLAHFKILMKRHKLMSK